MSQPVALTIAGSDPSGGAGVQADLKTFAAHDVYGASVISVITAQNAARFALFPVPAAFLAAQIEVVFEAFDLRAIKIGMLGGGEQVRTVIDGLHRYNGERKIPVVLDPVIRASNGGLGLDEGALALLREALLPLCTLIKPNLYEAANLLDEKPAGDISQMRAQAQRLSARHGLSVLLSGGHLPGSEAVDILSHAGEIHRFSRKKCGVADVHGTGCALTSAIAAQLAKGQAMKPAIEQAKTYLSALLNRKMQQDQSYGVISLDHLVLLKEQ